MIPAATGSAVATVALLLLAASTRSSMAALPAKAKPPFKIVHLGDSYSAGNGAGAYHGVSGCYRSSSNWGSQFAQSLTDVFSVMYVNRACSGGVLNDITNVRELDSTHRFPGADCPSPDFPDEESYVKTDLISCSHRLAPQIKAIDRSVDLVLLTIGGNDAQFSNIIEQCFLPVDRSGDDCRAAVAFANTALDALQPRLVSTFAAIRKQLKPEARVVLVAYPHLLLNVAYDVDGYTAGAEIRALSVRGDVIQSNAVAQANAAAGTPYIVYYDNTKNLFSGHEPNPSALHRNPERWINEFEGSHVAEYYHFNPLGHQNLGSALSVLETFGAVGGTTFGRSTSVDLAFVVDTTGSMGGVIAEVRRNLADLVSQLAAATSSYRVAVVSYRDFPERTGYSSDYPSRVDQTFTNDLSSIQTAINSLSADGGGDYPESVFSGIKAALDLSWHAGVTKVAIVIGDAPPLNNGGPEPISGLTAQQIVAASIALDPVQVQGVDVGGLASSDFELVVTGTGGEIFSGISSVTGTLSGIINSTSNKPVAWFGTAISGKIGTPVVFDAQGSYDPNGFPIDSFEWDFDGNGVFDLTTSEQATTHTYSAAFDGYVLLRVTSKGGMALASARATINAAGFVDQGDNNPCELDSNGFSIITGPTGIFLNCKAENLGTPAPTAPVIPSTPRPVIPTAIPTYPPENPEPTKVPIAPTLRPTNGPRKKNVDPDPTPAPVQAPLPPVVVSPTLQPNEEPVSKPRNPPRAPTTATRKPRGPT